MAITYSLGVVRETTERQKPFSSNILEIKKYFDPNGGYCHGMGAIIELCTSQYKTISSTGKGRHDYEDPS